MKYLPPRKACDILGVSEKSLRNWEQAGKIKAKCIALRAMALARGKRQTFTTKTFQVVSMSNTLMRSAISEKIPITQIMAEFEKSLVKREAEIRGKSDVK